VLATIYIQTHYAILYTETRMLLRMFSYFLTVVNLAMYVMLPCLKEGKHTLLHSTIGHTSLS